MFIRLKYTLKDLTVLYRAHIRSAELPHVETDAQGNTNVPYARNADNTRTFTK